MAANKLAAADLAEWLVAGLGQPSENSQDSTMKMLTRSSLETVTSEAAALSRTSSVGRPLSAVFME